MADLVQLERALRNADAAGDVEAARALARAITEVRRQGANTEAAPTPENSPSMSGSAALGALDTVTFGLADEIGSGLDWVADRILPGGQSRSYEEILGLNRGQQTLAQETNPGSYLTGQIAGGVGGGLGLARGGLSMAANAAQRGAGLGRVAGASAADGAILGAAQGAGSGEGLLGRAQSATTGLVAGGLVGGAAPVALAGGSAAVRTAASPFLSRIRPDEYASRALENVLRRSGQSPDDIVRSLQDATNDGQGMYTIADALGHPGQRALSAIARTPNDARQLVVDALQSRQMGQGDRLSNFLAEGFGAPDTAAQRTARLTAERSAAANANYGAARESAGMVDPTAAIQAADDFLQPGASRLLAPQTNIADDSIESAVRRARSYLTDGQSVITDFSAALRSKQELDAMIERAQPAVQRQLIPIRNALDNSLADASPDYSAARDTFRQQSRAIDAVDTGRSAASSRTRATDNIDTFSRMSPEEQAAFRAGYVDPQIARVEAASVSPTTNKARGLMTEKTGQEFQEFAAPGEAGRLGSRIDREDRMFQTANAALGGSKTADNLADAAELRKFDPTVVAQIFSGNLGGAAMSALSRVISETSGMTPAVAERFAKALLQSNPTAAREMLQRAQSIGQRQDAVRGNSVAGLLGLLGAGTGRLAAP